ncbi:MAG: lipid-binding SYLF domain-containing protein [Campylobacteraceae bacterium]|nr:lipid-binding SYLF domain-containing protein [Campylobacteraceae bacterium]
MKSFKITLLSLLLLFVTSLNAGWDASSEAQKAELRAQQINEAQVAVAQFKSSNGKLKVFFEEAYGFAIFANVGKAGILIGGAYGEGVVYQKNQVRGYSSLTQFSFGFQLGGQTYSEIIFFKNKESLDSFTQSNFELGAQVSAVAITSGISFDADYDNGIAIFTLVKGGLMFEAAVGGQKFNFEE